MLYRLIHLETIVLHCIKVLHILEHHAKPNLWISNTLHVKSTCDRLHVEVSFRARKVPANRKLSSFHGGISNGKSASVELSRILGSSRCIQTLRAVQKSGYGE